MNSNSISFSGKALSLAMHPNAPGVAVLTFDLVGESTNRINQLTLNELGEAVTRLEKEKSLKGLLVRSGKDAFIVGADVTEFQGIFKKPKEELSAWLKEAQGVMTRIENLPFPSVALITGFALGGGLELALACTFRLATAETKVGLPETKLGIIPGWGGTVRLPRLAGADNAIDWITSARQVSAKEAFSVGVLDGLALATDLEKAALQLLSSGGTELAKLRAERTKKLHSPLALGPVERMMTFQTSRAFVGAVALPHYPAPMAALDSIEKGASMGLEDALKLEREKFMEVCYTPQARALVNVFLSDQWIKKKSKKLAGGEKASKVGVLGAGIMGGGIAYQAASSKLPIVMKDIRAEALELGQKEAMKLFEKRLEKGQMKAPDLARAFSLIQPTLKDESLSDVDFVIEAVVENEGVKNAVLAQMEKTVSEKTVLASNTSTISITRLGSKLKHPERFTGMHFFNPVHRMPLVEVIRGEKSSDAAIGATVQLALAMGKTPIVVNDCPGFLVNRVLFPYFGAFFYLMRDGVEFERIDKVMEKFGWPMGPAYLLDVVGIDTAHHCLDVMKEGFPDRMNYSFETVLDLQYGAKRFGQKNGKGFFNYAPDPKGRPQKKLDPEVYTLIKPAMTGGAGKQGKDISDEEIVDRMMLAMLLECSRCLEDKIVDTPREADLALMYGLGFPAFRGGIFLYADEVGAKTIVEKSAKYESVSPMYKVTDQLKRLASVNGKFYE